jgi:hypothetical protein
LLSKVFLYEKGKQMLKKIISIISILCVVMLLSCKERTKVAPGINCDDYFSKNYQSLAERKTSENLLGMYSGGARFSYIDTKTESGFSGEIVFNNGRLFLMIRFVHPDKNLCFIKNSTIAFGYSPEEVYVLDGSHKANCAKEHHNKELGNYIVGLYEIPINSLFFKKLLVSGTPRQFYLDTAGPFISGVVMNDDSDFRFVNTARCIYESPLAKDLDIDDTLIDNTLKLKK